MKPLVGAGVPEEEGKLASSHGSYTYELCFFGRATQKSNKDHSSNHLGYDSCPSNISFPEVCSRR